MPDRSQLSKDDAGYIPRPKSGVIDCGSCANFGGKAGGCSVVAGDVDADDCCNFWNDRTRTELNPKISKTNAVFVGGSSSGSHACKVCRYFSGPESCQIVSGKIDPGGSCDLWVEGGDKMFILLEQKPYASLSELPDYIRRLSKSDQQRWRAIWNSVYKRAKADGKSDSEAESAAFATANGVLKRHKTDDLESPEEKFNPNEPRNRDGEWESGGSAGFSPLVPEHHSNLAHDLKNGFSKVKELGEGGATDPLLAHIKGDGRAVLKSGDATPFYPSGKIHMGLGEVAAHRLDRLLGLGVTPESVIVPDGPYKGYSANRYVGGTGLKVAYEMTPVQMREALRAPEADRTALLDYVIANDDRHDGNWLIRDGKPVPIDHGYSFRGVMGPSRFKTETEGRPIDPQVLDRLRKVTYDDVKAALGDDLISEERERRGVDLTQEILGRIKHLARAGKLDFNFDRAVYFTGDKLRQTKFNPNEPRNYHGEWSSGGNSSDSSSGSDDSEAPVTTLSGLKPTGIALSKSSNRAFNGEPVPQSSNLSKYDMGRLGESIAVQFLRQMRGADARPANEERPNFPVDVTYDHRVVEVKTGNVAASPDAQKWRLTIGQSGKRETAMAVQLSPEALRQLNADKAQAILDRKARVLRELSEELGHEVHPETLTLLVDHDAKRVDVYHFEGFHPIIRWKSPQAQHGYVGSFSYDSSGFKTYNPNESRNPHGEWTSGGSTSAPVRQDQGSAHNEWGGGSAETSAADSFHQALWRGAKGVEFDRAAGAAQRQALQTISDRLQSSPDFAAFASRTVSGQAPEDRIRNAASSLMSLWSNATSADSPRIAAMQRVAQEEFKLGNAHDPVRGNYSADAIKHEYRENGEAFRDFLRAQYSTTQNWLLDHRISSIPLWRGVETLPDGVKPGFGRSILQLNPLSSFSTDFDQAKTDFTGTTGATLLSRVPANRILSLPMTGMSSAHESEVVVLGGPAEAWVNAWRGRSLFHPTVAGRPLVHQDDFAAQIDRWRQARPKPVQDSW